MSYLLLCKWVSELLLRHVLVGFGQPLLHHKTTFELSAFQTTFLFLNKRRGFHHLHRWMLLSKNTWRLCCHSCLGSSGFCFPGLFEPSALALIALLHTNTWKINLFLLGPFAARISIDLWSGLLLQALLAILIVFYTCVKLLMALLFFVKTSIWLVHQ